VDFRFGADDEAFRDEVRTWLNEHLTGDFAALGGGGSAGQEDGFEVRREWERELGRGGWIGLSWPKEYGGREATVIQKLLFTEEYVKANAPARVGFFGEDLFGPTLMAFGTEEQKQRFLPPILRAEEMWCQGFSEPDAGSDLANVTTRAERDGDEWVLNGQKVWTTLAQHADWCFVVCRTDPDVPKHKGLSYVLCPMDQPGVEVKPLVQLTRQAEFNEVFFTDARTRADLVVGGVNEGWKVAMGTLGFERGTAFLSAQLRFQTECDAVIRYAQKLGHSSDPVVRQQLVDAWIGVQLLRYNRLRAFTRMAASGTLGPEASINKLQWSNWHRRLGELEMRVMGPWSEILGDDGPYAIDDFQQNFLFSRSETIYAGSSEIQRNIIGERVLGLPREPAPPEKSPDKERTS
jgi:alkylation response protein AidB-like acyl-CoA dehydrogenase